MGNKITIIKIINKDIEKTKELIRQYLIWVESDLSFQQVDEELATFSGKYEEPDGSFFTAKDGDEVIGCIGLRKIQPEICEMKRLFVKNEYKGMGIGKELIKIIIEEGRKKGYKKMRLDTLPKMKAAQNLYKEFGFYLIERYVSNPIEGTVYMEKILSD